MTWLDDLKMAGGLVVIVGCIVGGIWAGTRPPTPDGCWVRPRDRSDYQRKVKSRNRAQSGNQSSNKKAIFNEKH